MSNDTDRRAMSGMEEAKVLRIALESLQEQLSMLQKTLERLTEQNHEMAELELEGVEESIVLNSVIQETHQGGKRC